jgi:hypothetical protein
MRIKRASAAAAALLGLTAAYAGSATAEPGPTPWTYKQAQFGPQSVEVDKLTAASQMTKDLEAPARAFTGPTSMAVHPQNPRIVVAATADLRSKLCYLTVSKDAGRTWHLSEEMPTDPAYPFCTNTTAGVPEAMVAWGRDGTLYYAHMAYGEGEGPREGKSSAILARRPRWSGTTGARRASPRQSPRCRAWPSTPPVPATPSTSASARATRTRRRVTRCASRT